MWKALTLGVLKQAIAHDGPSLVDVIAQPLHQAAAGFRMGGMISFKMVFGHGFIEAGR